jgi:DeoR/GlpR family transcriptional regulator of sugar metabolism
LVAKPIAAAEAVFAPERQEQIAQMVADAGRVRVADLAAQFGVSPVTIRKDLLVLEGAARLVRTHGGAIAPRGTSRPEPAFEVRERLQRDEKTRIGAAAAALVQDGDSIVFDASTTALYVARQLKERGSWHQLTVVTNSIRIALELAGQAGVTVLMLGGRVRSEALSVVGPLGDGVFRRVNVQKAFVGAVGLTLEAGLSDAMEEEAQIKRSMVAAAREVYALVDHSKFGRTASATFCRTDRLTGIITDEAAPADMIAALREQGVAVTLVAAGAER